MPRLPSSGVNLIAFETRFESTWEMRSGSTSTVTGASGSCRSSRRLWATMAGAWTWTFARASSRRSTGSGRITMRPLSRPDSVSRSLISVSSRRAFWSMMSRNSAWSAVIFPTSPFTRMSV